MIMLGYCEMKWLNLVTVYIKGTSPTFNISNYHEISCLLTWVIIFLYISWSLTECFISSADIFLPWWTAVKSLLSMSLPISLLYIFQVVHLLCHNTRTLFPTFSDSFFFNCITYPLYYIMHYLLDLFCSLFLSYNSSELGCTNVVFWGIYEDL